MLVDLDGTLMAQDTISPRVAAAVKRVESVIPVSIATGRRVSDAIAYARALQLRSPQICNGGATLVDPTSGQHLWNSHLQPDTAREIIDRLDREQIPYIATHPTGDAETKSEIGSWDLTRISAMDITEHRAEELISKYQAVEGLYVVKVYLHYNGWWAVDFTATGVHKGRAAKELARMTGTQPASFIAAGDSFNDLPMLRLAGYRIVMAASPEELKQEADFLAPPVEVDGLAVAIEEVVLPQLLGVTG